MSSLRERLETGWEARREYAPFLLLGTAVLAFCLAVPILRVGDAADYALGTESLWYDHDLRYTRQDLLRHLALKPPGFDSPAGLHAAPGRDGAVWLGWHLARPRGRGALVLPGDRRRPVGSAEEPADGRRGPRRPRGDPRLGGVDRLVLAGSATVLTSSPSSCSSSRRSSSPARGSSSPGASWSSPVPGSPPTRSETRP